MFGVGFEEGITRVSGDDAQRDEMTKKGLSEVVVTRDCFFVLNLIHVCGVSYGTCNIFGCSNIISSA